MRTVEDIVKRCQNQEDVLGFRTGALVEFLTFEQAKDLRSEEATSEEWGEAKPLTRESVIDAMRSYMQFAWGKIEDHRGLSAERSIMKMEAWIWLLGDDEFLDAVKNAAYAQYGAPKLALICQRYDLPIPQSTEIQNMIAGQPCRESCEEGCGHPTGFRVIEIGVANS